MENIILLSYGTFVSFSVFQQLLLNELWWWPASALYSFSTSVDVKDFPCSASELSYLLL